MSIIVLAMIAAFLGLRLYSVLGKRTGHEQEPVLPAEDRVVQFPRRTSGNDDGAGPAAGPPPAVEAGAEAGIRALIAADRSFDPGHFVEGAQGAYRMILEAFWSGDRDTLGELTDSDTFAAFDAAITARETAGETLDNRLVGIDRARIVAASVTGGTARVTVLFDADIAAVTRDRDGQVIAGSMTDAVETHDRWTFVRDIGSDDPAWKLDETEAG